MEGQLALLIICNEVLQVFVSISIVIVLNAVFPHLGNRLDIVLTLG